MIKLNKAYISQWIFVFALLTSASAFAGKIRINEIYYDPPGVSSTEVDSEFIELYVVEGGFDPSGWYLLDWDSDHKKWAVPDSCPQVQTGDYIVFHFGKGANYDSSGVYHFYMGEASSKLSNSGDPIGLRDDKDIPRDFVTYKGGTDSELTANDYCSWPNDGLKPLGTELEVPSDSGFSLQFSGDNIDNSKNWIIAEPTCGYENVKKEIVSKPSDVTDILASPQPFIIDGSGDLKINFSLTYGANVTLRIYDVRGRLRVSLKEEASFPGGVNSVDWDGKDEEGRDVKMGIYILYMEVRSEQGVSSLKKTVVVGKRK
ncbi:MAG: lamin tail domain-containing protein [bacterium]|nr:lamin tail domain-containing protein [bacterium]